ncbi:MAG TPA: crossover junction endodeoxyribonuclease RuvC [Thermoanaerobaculia bacterium]|nr:crossover junction endodeoxyribonuclease RuvC [Thermoanaerobaculia bacterium]
MRKSPVRILGIDPGSVTTGYGVIDQVKGKLVLVEQGTIRTARGEELADRLLKIFTGLGAVIARTSPETVAVESPFAGQNPRSLIQLSHARGVILLAARSAGLPVHEYSPRSVKSAVVGYGGAEKEQVGKMIRLLVSGIGEQLLAADASDALAIAVCHAHHASFKARVRTQ